MATAKQEQAIKNLCEHLGKRLPKIPETTSMASVLLTDLIEEVKQHDALLAEASADYYERFNDTM